MQVLCRGLLPCLEVLTYAHRPRAAVVIRSKVRGAHLKLFRAILRRDAARAVNSAAASGIALVAPVERRADGCAIRIARATGKCTSTADAAASAAS